MIVVAFRVYVNPEADVEELGAVSQHMVALFGEAPGCIAVKDYSAPDGEMLVLAEFDSLEGGRRLEVSPGTPHCAAARAGGVLHTL